MIPCGPEGSPRPHGPRPASGPSQEASDCCLNHYRYQLVAWDIGHKCAALYFLICKTKMAASGPVFDRKSLGPGNQRKLMTQADNH